MRTLSDMCDGALLYLAGLKHAGGGYLRQGPGESPSATQCNNHYTALVKKMGFPALCARLSNNLRTV